MISPDSQKWSSYTGSLRAALDEYSRANRDLEKILIPMSPERYNGETQLSDGTFANIRDIMYHVIRAAHVYVDYLDGAIDQSEISPPEHDFNYDTPTTAMQSLWAAFSRMVVTLGKIRDYSEKQQSEVKFTARWGVEYDIEQLLEHAIVHILRHRRQVELWLASPISS